MSIDSPLVIEANALRTLLRHDSAEIERQRRLTPAVINALYDMKAFNLQLDERYGGAAADPMTHLQVIEALSRADASSGWCAMVGSESSACINAFLEPSVITEMTNAADRSVLALSAVGKGQAHEVEGGYRVTGRWRFVSGCRHSKWLGGLCPIYRNGEPRLRETGAPVMRLLFAPADSVTFIDTWHTSGLCGTASDDFTLEETFIAREYSLDLFGPPVDDAPVWQIPNGLRFAMSKAAAVCGMARGAMDGLLPLLDRVPFAGAQAARLEPRVHLSLAQAEAAIEGGRAYLYQNVTRLWESVLAGTKPDMRAIADVRLAVVFAAERATAASQLIAALGGTAAALDQTLDRAVRDLNVARHHLQLQAHVSEDIGRVLVDLPPRNPMF